MDSRNRWLLTCPHTLYWLFHLFTCTMYSICTTYSTFQISFVHLYMYHIDSSCLLNHTTHSNKVRHLPYLFISYTHTYCLVALYLGTLNTQTYYSLNSALYLDSYWLWASHLHSKWNLQHGNRLLIAYSGCYDRKNASHNSEAMAFGLTLRDLTANFWQTLWR